MVPPFAHPGRRGRSVSSMAPSPGNLCRSTTLKAAGSGSAPLGWTFRTEDDAEQRRYAGFRSEPEGNRRSAARGVRGRPPGPWRILRPGRRGVLRQDLGGAAQPDRRPSVPPGHLISTPTGGGRMDRGRGGRVVRRRGTPRAGTAARTRVPDRACVPGPRRRGVVAGGAHPADHLVLAGAGRGWLERQARSPAATAALPQQANGSRGCRLLHSGARPVLAAANITATFPETPMTARRAPPLAPPGAAGTVREKATATTPPYRDGPGCQVCRRPLPRHHHHVLDTEHCAILCTCPACSALFHRTQAR